MVKLVPNEDKTNLIDENKIVGYIDQEILYGFDAEGYAVEIGHIDNQNAERMFREWRKSQQSN